MFLEVKPATDFSQGSFSAHLGDVKDETWDFLQIRCSANKLPICLYCGDVSNAPPLLSHLCASQLCGGFVCLCFFQGH